MLHNTIEQYAIWQAITDLESRCRHRASGLQIEIEDKEHEPVVKAALEILKECNVEIIRDSRYPNIKINYNKADNKFFGEKRMKHLEATYQQQVVEWSKWAYKAKPTQYPNLDLLHCSLNGVKLTKTQAVIAKGQGMLSGVPDLFLPVPKNGFHGLFIEMKSEKGKITDNQHWFLTNAEGLGYKTVVCYSANEAISAIQAYYGKEITKCITQDLPCVKTQNRAYSEGCCESH